MADITRKSLGRNAAVGDLYDATTDSFCGKNIFSDLSGLKIETTQLSAESIDIVNNDDSIFNNLMKCDIEPELAVSALCGLVPLSFLSNYATKGILARSLFYTVKTKTDRLEIKPSQLKRYIDAADIADCPATHVVVGIEWGSLSVLSIERSEENGQNDDDLKKCSERIASRISNSGAEAIIDPELASKYNIYFESDIITTGSPVPEPIDNLIAFIKNIPELIKSDHNGCGKCLSFILCPLSYDDTRCTVQFVEPKDVCLMGDFVSNLAVTQIKLQSIEKSTDENDFCVPTNIKKTIKMKKAVVGKAMKTFTESLVAARKGEIDSFDLDVTQQTLNESSSGFDQFFRDIQPIVDRIEFISSAKRQGALYIGCGSSVEQARRKIRPNDEYYVLFLAYSLYDEKTSENMFLFEALLKGKVACILADLDMQPDLAEKEDVPSGTRICHYQQNEYKNVDVFKTYKNDRKFSCMRSLFKMEPNMSKPKKRAIIHLICPGSLNCGECGREKQQWMCESCKSTVEYGFDGMFYCDCGRGDINTFEFRCTDVNHGDEFIAFEDDVLMQKLNEIEAVPDYNILVLGETGVGKSTWINALANYLTYPTLQEATDADELLCLIPAKFVLLDENCTEKVVSIGSSKNEATRAGQACTQHPTSHLVTVGNERIRIIDTPGIGDPRGVEQDKINVDNILRFVSDLDEIHGICLLLKPNNARLTTFFKFCVKEILAHLHKSSAHNILFCFTNTRSTFYKPGDTYPALKELLSEINDHLKLKCKSSSNQIVLSGETMFCLDNEAFRFLCARRNNIEFEPEDFQNFSLSWDKSATETQRMIAYIKSRKPHRVTDTLSINEARNTILTLARPMAKISDNIATNIRVAEDQKKFTMSLNDEKLKLEKNRLIQQIQITTVPIDYPKTVCTNGLCVEIRGIPGSSENMVVYKTVCHDHCYLQGVSVDTVGAEPLRYCAAMNRTSNCVRCGCIWQNHMHITYDFKEVMVEMPNVTVEKMIKENAEARLVKEKMVSDLQQRIEQYQSEQQEILNISSKFGALLKQNAIIPYNDAFEAHVRHELQLASAEAYISKDSAKKKDDLERLLKEYLQKQRMLDDAMMRDNDFDINVDDVDNLKNQLMNLSLSGESFQNCFRTATNAQSFNYTEKRVNINRRAKNSQWKRPYKMLYSTVATFFNLFSQS